MHHPIRRHFAPAILCLALLVGAGCSERSDRLVGPWRPILAPPPVPSSPAAAVEILRQDWERRAPVPYGELFTDDFQFIFSERDSAGSAFRDHPWGRGDEMASARNMFVTGTQYDPPATSITLDFTSEIVAYDDVRTGMNPRWHKQVHVQLLLRMNRGDNGFEIKGSAQFYLVRGDSARIPPELLDRGFRPDSTRWWIQRWEDETLQDQAPVSAPARAASPMAAQPTQKPTLGAIKVLYR